MSVIAVSRGSLLATRKLVEGLKTRLKYKVISREEVIDAAGRYGIEETGLGEKDIMELHPPGYWHERSNERAHYLTCFKAALLTLPCKVLSYITEISPTFFLTKSLSFSGSG